MNRKPDQLRNAVPLVRWFGEPSGEVTFRSESALDTEA